MQNELLVRPFTRRPWSVCSHGTPHMPPASPPCTHQHAPALAGAGKPLAGSRGQVHYASRAVETASFKQRRRQGGAGLSSARRPTAVMMAGTGEATM